jgi:epoxide hydrolase-like predicted phosphatase
MNEHLEGVKAIIFDLGNVIIELHYDRSIRMLQEITGRSETEISEMLVTAPLLQQFEVGKISEDEFRKSFSEHMNISVSPKQFDEIWNALLGEISLERIERLAELKKKYRTCVLSNTNAIHERCFNQNLQSSHGFSEIGELVDYAYYSHHIQLRKPDADIYEFVLAQEDLLPTEVLFIDDREDNILAASKLGIHTFINSRVDDWLNDSLWI